MAIQFNKDTIIADILKEVPEAVPVFKSLGMNCLGCAMASGETLGEACSVHGVDSDVILEQLAAITK